MSRNAKRTVRTFDATNHVPRFRPETVARSDRPRLSATIGECFIAKQIARLESGESSGR